MLLSLQNEVIEIAVSPRGGALTHARLRDGRDFLRPLNGDFSVRASACYPLVPLGNRIGGNRFRFAGREHRLRPNSSDPLYLHGDGWLADWAVTRKEPGLIALSHSVKTPDCGVHIYRAEQRFMLDGNQLRIGISVENQGAEPMPFGLGLHPFMPARGADIRFRARAFWTESPENLPESRNPISGAVDFSGGQTLPDLALNNAYEGWDGRADILWPDGPGLVMRADPVFSVLMAYAPADDRSFFCLEPMTHLPNALNMEGQPGMTTLAPGESLAGAVSFTVTG
ncbi:MAG: aldose 1-epimerase [Paracoccus sp. (in: a-proteobacteria)]|nr:aldose 1-epimerase [Paracoccus sp. (in: a-proteobacteria)]